MRAQTVSGQPTPVLDLSARVAALAAIFVVAAGFRFGYGLLRPPQPRGSALVDPDGYVGLSQSVASMGGLYEGGHPSAHREPGYPVYLGLWFKLLGATYGSVLLSNVLLALIALYGLYRVGDAILGPTLALEATALAAVYPPFIFYAAQPMRETAMLAVSALALWSVVVADRDRTIQSCAVAGAVNAVACLTNTTFLPFAILVPVGLLILRPKDAVWRAAIRGTLLYGATFACLYAAWPIRNYRAFGQLVVGSTAGAGSTFYMYLKIPEEYGGTPKQQEMLDRDPVNAKGAALPTPLQRERFFWKAGTAVVRSNPARYARLVAWRFLDSWRLVPRERSYAHSYRLIRWVSFATDGWIIPLGFIGMILAIIRSRAPRWVCAFVLSTDAAYALVFTMIRYRLSLMPWMILFAVMALERLRAYPKTSTVPGGAAIAPPARREERRY